MLTAIPLTLYLLQKQQETRSHASPSTILEFTPDSNPGAPIQKNAGDQFDLHVQMDPGTNQVDYTLLVIDYDPTKFTTAGAGFVPNNSAFPAQLTPVRYQAGKVTAELGIGAGSTNVIQSLTEVGVLTLKAIAANTPAANGDITFDGGTLVYTAGAADAANTNVLSTSHPAFITVAATPTTPTPTLSPTVAPTGTPGPTTPVQAPVCTSLNADRTAAGSAPFSIALTATGNDPVGTISKVTFDFGDGPIHDVTSGGGIGTKVASVQVSHTYNNAGTYRATAYLTNDRGVLSSTTTCNLTVTVSAPGAGTIIPTQPVAVATATPIASPTATPIPTQVIAIASPTPILRSGPGDLFIGIGAIGGILSIIGAALFFVL